MGRKRPHHGNRRRGSGRSTPRRREVLTGRLVVTRPGCARVETPEGAFDLAARGMREAMNGDEVQVVLVSERGRRPRAVVRSVLSRATESFLGRLEDAGPLMAVVPLDARIGRDFFVLPQDDSPRRLGCAPGDVVVGRIVEYPTRTSAAVVTVDRRVGSADELDLNVESVVASHGLPADFPASVEEAAAALDVDVDAELARDERRRDARDRPCVTIDPVDARDFDDAVGARELPDGGFELDVHIADVTRYVGPGDPVDEEARRRTCSAYLVDRVIPMLPERLSCDLCSLRPGEDRLAMTVTVRLDARGRVVRSRAASTVVRSRARLDYDQVDAFLDGRAPASSLCGERDLADSLGGMLRVLDRIRGLRQRVRRERGSIDFETPEAKVALDADGRPTGVRVRRKTRATALVEEAMLVANECVASMLGQAEAPAAFRVHERPAPEDLRATVAPLDELGLLDAQTTAGLLAGEPAAIQRVLARAEGTEAARAANALLLRAQRRAVYLPSDDGHFALGAQHYCHFTSPIRRYPDVLVHRALKALLAGKLEGRQMRAQAADLAQLCRTCSERERAADAAERESQRIKIAELFSAHVGERFAGTVSGCASFGAFVMLDETCAEGLLPVRALGHDWYVYDEARMSLVGESSGDAWRLGRRVVVEVAGVDVPRGRIDFVLPREG